MPILEFQCAKGHITEELFLTFAESDKATKVPCMECAKDYKVGQVVPAAKRIISLPGAPILLGDGFYKPAASGRTHTKGSDATKTTNEFLQQMGGGKGVIKQAKGK